MKLLIIEDDIDILSFLTKGLQEEGHIIDSATNGEDGEHLALVNIYDLIVQTVLHK
jgi:DNA-binding response OmpR family regulator